jgi:hypothetical protein
LTGRVAGDSQRFRREAKRLVHGASRMCLVAYEPARQQKEAHMKDTWKQTSAWMAALVGVFIVLLSFMGMLVFDVRAQRPGYGIVEITLEGAIAGALFYLWRQQVTQRRREVLAISRMLEARNGYIREQLQLISLRYGNDPAIVHSVSQIVHSLEIKLPSETKKGRAAA